MRTRRTFISVKLSSPKMIRTTATTTFSNASSCSLFIMLFRFLLPDNLLTFSVPVSPRLGAGLGGGRTFVILAARGFTDEARFNGGTGGAVLNSGGGTVSFPLPFLAGWMGIGGADLSTGGAGMGGGGAGLGAISGALAGRGGT